MFDWFQKKKVDVRAPQSSKKRCSNFQAKVRFAWKYFRSKSWCNVDNIDTYMHIDTYLNSIFIHTHTYIYIWWFLFFPQGSCPTFFMNHGDGLRRGAVSKIYGCKILLLCPVVPWYFFSWFGVCCVVWLFFFPCFFGHGMGCYCVDLFWLVRSRCLLIFSSEFHVGDHAKLRCRNRSNSLVWQPVARFSFSTVFFPRAGAVAATRKHVFEQKATSS